MDGNVAAVASVAGATFVIASGLLGLGWWLSGQLHGVGNVLGEKLDLVEKALETRMTAHEKLDDERFKTVELEMLMLKLRHAPSENGLPKSPYQVP